MKLVMYESSATGTISQPHPLKERGQGGVLLDDAVFNLAEVCRWADVPACQTVMEFVALSGEVRATLASRVNELAGSDLARLPSSEVRLYAPIGLPPSVRDFYAFEQHVKTARANRGLDMIPEWYDFPVFYFSNHRAIIGPDQPVLYPRGSQALDFELELACVIGGIGRNIKASEAVSYIAGYVIMNDWSARDLQTEEMKLNMGPVKGKDFATSLGPWLVTPDELDSVRQGDGASERFSLTMRARLNGQEISQGNASTVYFSFPQMIERAALNTWLVPGDVLGSGTVGTGCLLEQGDRRERYLQVGDVMELEIDRLGILRNPIIADEQA